MICPHCGKTTAEDSIFCEHCGQKIEKTAAPKKKSNWLLWVILGLILSAGVAAAVIYATQQNNKKVTTETVYDDEEDEEYEDADDGYEGIPGVVGRKKAESPKYEEEEEVAEALVPADDGDWYLEYLVSEFEEACENYDIVEVERIAQEIEDNYTEDDLTDEQVDRILNAVSVFEDLFAE